MTVPGRLTGVSCFSLGVKQKKRTAACSSLYYEEGKFSN